eukprot:TRINITY_DN10286_c0_g2_i1.p1 TRINITY_DN10286_c0_g2~~TRINITY_DN10286_c0_g2_i1.p1  ORF type:complete len:423 (-),score=100.11 TRINITY_DN10286_c0_g2_i1:157-1341(-)
MISYSQLIWKLFFSVQGSVVPAALMWAVPLSLVAGALKWGIQFFDIKVTSTPSGVLTTVAGFITMLSFMLAFRANSSFTRYWEGAELVQQTRGVWQNAVSSLNSFFTEKPEKQAEVSKVKNQVVRLMSLMFSSALSALSDGEEFEAFGVEDLDRSKLAILDTEFFDEDNRCELMLSWIQATVMRALRAGVVDAPPPIVSRVFQELGQGMVRVCNAKKINEVQYPFMMAQLIAVMLLLFSVGVALGTGYTMDSIGGAAACTFLNVSAVWCVHYASVALEKPFGRDLVSLPMQAEMVRMNKCLSLLVMDESAIVPSIDSQQIQEGKFRDKVVEAERKVSSSSGPRGTQIRKRMVASKASHDGSAPSDLDFEEVMTEDKNSDKIDCRVIAGDQIFEV